MATRSRIGIIDNRTGVVTSIYCHWDGYPENNGRILVEHWSDLAKIQQLMKLGDLSSLGKELGKKQDFDQPTDSNWCLAYGRDRGETRIGATTHNTLNEFLDDGEQYNYLWDGVRWNCFEGKTLLWPGNWYNIKQTA